MGRYDNDPRVVREHSGFYRLPDPSEDGDDWLVRRQAYGWTARSVHGQQLMDETDRHCRRVKAFGSADAAIGHIIGDPADQSGG